MPSFLKERYYNFNYTGIDITPSMIAEAKKLYPEATNSFFVTATPPNHADYVVASGIFNVKGEFSCPKWTECVMGTLDIMNEYSPVKALLLIL